jgi:hypothetical protein
MKFVLRRTSTYQHGISTYQKMYSHVLPCTAMYCHVLPCTAMYCQKYVLVRTRTCFWSFVCTSMYLYVLCTCMYCHAKNYQKYIHVRTTQEYKVVRKGTYRYVLVRTVIHQLYRIPVLYIVHTEHIQFPECTKSAQYCSVVHSWVNSLNFYCICTFCTGITTGGGAFDWPWYQETDLEHHQCLPRWHSLWYGDSGPETAAGQAVGGGRPLAFHSLAADADLRLH